MIDINCDEMLKEYWGSVAMRATRPKRGPLTAQAWQVGTCREEQVKAAAVLASSDIQC